MMTKFLFEAEFDGGRVFITCKDLPGLAVNEKSLPDALRRAGDDVFKLAGEALLAIPHKGTSKG
jgi:hypothetical protein